jgi:hypothetical protein
MTRPETSAEVDPGAVEGDEADRQQQGCDKQHAQTFGFFTVLSLSDALMLAPPGSDDLGMLGDGGAAVGEESEASSPVKEVNADVELLPTAMRPGSRSRPAWAATNADATVFDYDYAVNGAVDMLPPPATPPPHQPTDAVHVTDDTTPDAPVPGGAGGLGDDDVRDDARSRVVAFTPDSMEPAVGRSSEGAADSGGQGQPEAVLAAASTAVAVSQIHIPAAVSPSGGASSHLVLNQQGDRQCDVVLDSHLHVGTWQPQPGPSVKDVMTVLGRLNGNIYGVSDDWALPYFEQCCVDDTS